MPIVANDAPLLSKAIQKVIRLNIFNHIDLKKTIILGNQPGTNRVDRLVFCVERNEHLILTHDAGSNEIVEARAVTDEDKISEKKIRRAVWLQSPELHDRLFHPSAPGARVRIIGRFIDEQGSERKKSLGGYRFNPVPMAVDVLLNNVMFLNLLRTRVNERGLRWDQLHEVLLKDDEGFFLNVVMP